MPCEFLNRVSWRSPLREKRAERLAEHVRTVVAEPRLLRRPPDESLHDAFRECRSIVLRALAIR